MRAADESASITPVPRLQEQIDGRLILFCIALLGIDIFFISAYLLHEFYVSSYNDGVPLLGPGWDISRGRPYAETLGYLKFVLILILLIGIPRVWNRRVYLACAVIFAFVLAEDAWHIHDVFDFHPAAVFDLVASTPLIAAAAIAAFRSPKEDCRNGFLMLAALVMLMLFAIVGDAARMVGRGDLRKVHVLLYVIEDGGEQIILSLTCGLAILIRRDVRDREPYSQA